VLADAWIFQVRQSRELDERLRNVSATSLETTRQSEPVIAPETIPMVSDDGLVGRLEITRLGLSTIVVEGVGKTDLGRAVGHIPGTAFPGQGGNVGIAGHRDTHFRPLKGVHVNDLIVLTTATGEYRYKVVSSEVVSPDAIEVLDPTPDEVLTLVTCYPFYFVGPAPSRFIVRAQRI
jgi:sortase A